MMQVAVLFARADSIYKNIAGCDVFDIERDARRWPGGCPVVAHPPCRSWSTMSHFAKPVDGERELATWAAGQVQRWGGVLEHPANSRLWREAGLPAPGARDAFGGWTLAAPQMWWGHRAEKNSRFYVVGIEPRDMPAIPFVMGEAPRKMTNGGSHPHAGEPGYRVEVTRRERDATPPLLAAWLVDLARRTTPAMQVAA